MKLQKHCLFALGTLAFVSSGAWALTTPTCSTGSPKDITYMLMPATVVSGQVNANNTSPGSGILGSGTNNDPIVTTDHLHVHVRPKKKNISNVVFDTSTTAYECRNYWNGTAWVVDPDFYGTSIAVSVLGAVLIDTSQTVAARIPVQGIGFANGGALANLPNQGHRFKNVAQLYNSTGDATQNLQTCQDSAQLVYYWKVVGWNCTNDPD